MTSLRPVRGTRDLVGDDMRAYRHVVETAHRVAARHGYQEIATPIFEFIEVFSRPLGETSDVVSKEMYAFEDRGGERLALRPEFTASVARAFISGAFGQALPVKLFCSGPAFRYERPQKGRYRQFHQIDAEILGAPEPLADIEVIALGHAILSELGLADHITLELNSLGDGESRRAYRERLVGYLERFKDDLSEDSQARLERNPLRILDSKNKRDREIVGEAPRLTDCFNETSLRFYEQVQEGLEALGIPFEKNPKLVRGLDYYSHTAFEYTTTELGAQSAVLAGGRYDGLIATLGGQDTAGIGWAAGIERLSMLIGELPARPRTIVVVPMGDGMEIEALKLATELRTAGHHVDYGFKGRVGQRLKRAAQQNARHAVMIGEDELAAGKVVLRDLDAGEQQEIERAVLGEHLSRRS
ncbi:MAG: histidine--tRNA ligase [Alphaproteobacteria bacterium]|nr:histidine--tRNA ligase [Alphaproteobacteria bacterium]